MIWNRFTSDDLANNFLKEVAKLQSLKKKAELKPEESLTTEVKPEDFLVTENESVDVYDQDLNDKIDSISNYAVEKPCSECHKVHDAQDSCGDVSTNMAEDQEEEEDMSFLVDKKAEYILYRLGKIASGLRKKNEVFAADMVEVTALDIKKEVIAKAAQKVQVITGLKKMAKKSYDNGDQLIGDVISVTIENIKKAK